MNMEFLHTFYSLLRPSSWTPSSGFRWFLSFLYTT